MIDPRRFRHGGPAPAVAGALLLGSVLAVGCRSATEPAEPGKLAEPGEMAVDEGLQASRLDPDAVDVWEFLSNATRAAGRRDDELEARRQLAYLQQDRR